MSHDESTNVPAPQSPEEADAERLREDEIEPDTGGARPTGADEDYASGDRFSGTES